MKLEKSSPIFENHEDYETFISSSSQSKKFLQNPEIDLKNLDQLGNDSINHRNSHYDLGIKILTKMESTEKNETQIDLKSCKQFHNGNCIACIIF